MSRLSSSRRRPEFRGRSERCQTTDAVIGLRQFPGRGRPVDARAGRTRKREIEASGETMRDSKTPKAALVIVAVFAVVSSPAVAEAQPEADVLVLLTEIVDADVTGEEEIRFWWRGTDEPRWTTTDRAVFDGLRAGGVEPVEPREVDISRIYRRPDLSGENAAQIGGLMDAPRVLVGTVEYRRIDPVVPLRYGGIEVRAEVELLPGGDGDPVALDRFNVTRRFYEGQPEELLAEARQLAGKALGEVMGRTLQRARGEIGMTVDRDLLALRDLERADNLEAVRDRLAELEEVERVVERWAAEGVVALDVVPAGDRSHREVLEYATRVVANHDFEEFRLVASDQPVAENTVEFRVDTASLEQ